MFRDPVLGGGAPIRAVAFRHADPVRAPSTGRGVLAFAFAMLVGVSPGILPLPRLARPVAPIAAAPVAQTVPQPAPRAVAHGPVQRIAGPVGPSLYHALRDAGVPLMMVADYLRAIGGHLDIEAVRPVDRFDLVAARGPDGGMPLVAAGLDHYGAPLALVRLHGRWFDAQGRGPRRDGGFAMPVAGRPTSGFGMRFHPVLGYTRMHQGVDLAAPSGTPIVAAAAGVVRFAGWHGGHGEYVRIDHPGGLATGYGHMSAFAVTAGGVVRQGDVIGFVDATGLATGPHLHFEVLQDGVAIDPAAARLDTTEMLPVRDLATVRAASRAAAALPSYAAADLGG